MGSRKRRGCCASWRTNSRSWTGRRGQLWKQRPLPRRPMRELERDVTDPQSSEPLRRRVDACPGAQRTRAGLDRRAPAREAAAIEVSRGLGQSGALRYWRSDGAIRANRGPKDVNPMPRSRGLAIASADGPNWPIGEGQASAAAPSIRRSHGSALVAGPEAGRPRCSPGT